MAINSTTISFVLPIRSLMMALLLIAAAFSPAQAQGQCDRELTEAEAKFQVGKLNEAIAQTLSCLEKSDLDTTARTRAYKLLGRAYYAIGLLNAAKENLQKLLELIPNWRPDPEKEGRSFQMMVDEIAKEMEAKKQPPKPVQVDTSVVAPPTKKSGSKKWLWIGGGALAAGTTAAFILFRGDEKAPPRLPNPPDLPR